MGSSCMQNKRDAYQHSFTSQQSDTLFRYQQDVNLVHPKQVSDTISSVSSYSSVQSMKQKKKCFQKSHFSQMKDNISKYKETKRQSLKTENNEKNQKNSMEYLCPSPQFEKSESSFESIENQTITLSIPKHNKKNQKSLSSRRIYSKKDLLDRVKQTQRHSMIVKVDDT